MRRICLPVLASILFVSSAHADPKGYVVNEITVSDPATFKTYAEQVPATLTEFGGKYAARGKPEAISGEIPSPVVVIVEFPSLEKARAWRESDAYKKILRIREASSTSRVYLIKGAE